MPAGATEEQWIMTQFISSQDSAQELQFPIMLKAFPDQERKQYHRKKLFELSLNSVGAIPQLDEPDRKQKEWVIGKMKAPAQMWQRWFVGLYFTEEQKRELGLTDIVIAHTGIR